MMKILNHATFALLIVFLVHVSADLLPASTVEINGHSPNQNVNQGSNAILWCNIINLNDKYVIWYKRDKNLLKDPISLFFGKHNIIRENRYSIESSNNQNYSISIKNVQGSDAGIYKCAVQIDVENQISQEIRLDVMYPPIIHNDVTTSSVIVPSKGLAELKCQVSGHPDPHITWTRENNALFPDGLTIFRGNQLVIPNASREYAGIYYCVADNKVGDSVKKSFRVKVEYLPIIEVGKPRVGQALNFNATLECRVSAEPAASISWVDNNGSPIQIVSSPKIELSHYATHNDYTRSVLQIIAVERSQYGKYTCKATNRFGSANASIDFYQTEEEQCVAICGSTIVVAKFELIYSITLTAIAFFIRL